MNLPENEFNLDCTAGLSKRTEELTIQVNNYDATVEIFTTETEPNGDESVGLVNLTFTEFEALKKWINEVDLTVK